jgi:Na+-driven multidrug efflux pump
MVLLIELISLYFIGNTGTSEMLAGVGLANVYLNVTTFSIIVAVNAGLSTLVPQSYGQGNLRLCGLYLNRARVAGVFVLVPIFLLLLFSK